MKSVPRCASLHAIRKCKDVYAEHVRARIIREAMKVENVLGLSCCVFTIHGGAVRGGLEVGLGGRRGGTRGGIVRGVAGGVGGLELLGFGVSGAIAKLISGIVEYSVQVGVPFVASIRCCFSDDIL